jgi:hypothetical protein
VLAFVQGASYHNIPEHTLLIGVYQPNSPGSYNQIDTFAAQAGYTPHITSYYSTFQMPFATAFAEEAIRRGTEVLVQWQPRGTTNQAVAAGTNDVYITAFANAVKALNYQVIISYGQEMNGNWYPWGNMAPNTPAQYIAAYRHVWSIFQQQQVRNVTWLWDPNITYPGASPMSLWYPGDQYVDIVGLDGYFAYPADTFTSLFGLSIDQLRAFTSKPLLIAESGVTGSQGASQLAGLFSGAALIGAVGIVYFDEAQSGDPQHQDWRLENNSGNMTAFQQAVQQYGQRPLVRG